jgi:hypothetical protein
VKSDRKEEFPSQEEVWSLAEVQKLEFLPIVFGLPELEHRKSP